MIEGHAFEIKSLVGGGIITNYNCSSQCRHCLYAGGPQREKDFIDAETARRSFSLIRALRCNAIHIGGGEPLLNPEGVMAVLETAHLEGVFVEYVETNSSWYQDSQQACDLLRQLQHYGLTTLLVSISPFHNEHIPFNNVKGVVDACEKTGMNVFPWVLDFYKDLDAFDGSVTHPLEEYITNFGNDYLEKIPSRYWLHFGGRALRLFEDLFEKKKAETILEENREGCLELVDTNHFHVDLYGNYIPGLCSGLSIQIDDLGMPIPEEKYPLQTGLFKKGIQSLFDFAVEGHGYSPTRMFISKCDLCTDIRKFLVLERGVVSHELQPSGFYKNL